jgi:hypothetical protein
MTGTSFGDTDNDPRQTIYINALELPILVAYKANLQVGFIKFLGGLNASLVLGQVSWVTNPGWTVTDYSSSINYFNVGFVVGVSYSFPLKIGLLAADLRYEINLTPAYKDFGENNTHQHNLNFSIGYSYPL